mmetsp:Transcript_70972/g.208001  ORF Transcript_70972/g.208001 Transcript_70972/m.208001 type:complete len:143 (-) Transcript_70972:71-499(-)
MPTLLESGRGGSRAGASAQKEVMMEQGPMVEQKAETKQAAEQPRTEHSPRAKPEAEVEDAKEDLGPWQELSSVGTWLESHPRVSATDMMTDQQRKVHEYAMSLPLIKYMEAAAPPPNGGILCMCCSPELGAEEVVCIEKLHL